MSSVDEPWEGFGEICDVLVPLVGDGPGRQQLAQGVQLGPSDRFRLLGPVPSGQAWRFQPGEIVRCNIKVLGASESHWQAVEGYPPDRAEHGPATTGGGSHMSSTFADLGIPFPLFEGPADQANEYVGKGTCSLCGSERQHVFQLGIGCAVMLDCPSCGTSNGLDADDRADGDCRHCKATVPFPDLDDEEIAVCHACLRAGRAAISKDTELGMVSWEQAFEGVTHGVPGLNHPDFEVVTREDDWVGARLPREFLFELLRTPTYRTIQGEQWPFCCRRPMVFVDEWCREDFAHHAPDGDARRFFEEIVQDCVPGLWEDELHDVTGVYVFRCPSCDRMTAHWDIA